MTSRKRPATGAGPAKIVTKTQVSAGGVAYRRTADHVNVALVSVGAQRRWQLPKGIVEPDESPEAAAVRETREEAGVATSVVEPIELVEYWYVATDRGERVRVHKFVHFYLLAYESGAVEDHDHEVHEARWVEIGEAAAMLAFASERRVVERAREMLRSR